jgi:hypothetical protein
MKKWILMSIALFAIFAVSCKHVETKKCKATCKDSLKVQCDTLKQADSTKVAK